jgi:hypothetical protein
VIIQVDTGASSPSVALGAPDDFATFKVVVQGPAPDAERLAAAIAHIGRMSGESHAFIDVEAVLALADARAQDQTWRALLEEMLDYARAHGWLDERGAIRAHVEWADNGDHATERGVAASATAGEHPGESRT